MSYEKERNVPKLVIIRNTYQLTLEETFDYLGSIKNDITISL